jgi:HKD family nuclease
MDNEKYILKKRLQELINDRPVQAGLFYTFNFDPRFFENYIMPLLVPDQQFVNNDITNNIVWRRLYKDGRVPPVTVYFDQDAKTLTNGPMLSYEIRGVSMPGKEKKKGNFHPKNSFILVLNEDGTHELIVITGSNNITQSGWCDNIECISELMISENSDLAEQVLEGFKEMIFSIRKTFGGKKSNSEAESIILNFLEDSVFPKRNADIALFHSFQGSFKHFLDELVFKDNSIKTIEIISPYLTADEILLDYLFGKKLSVRMLMPMLGGYCICDEKIAQKYSSKGVIWFQSINEKGTESGSKVERRSHAKIYRFYGAEKIYTIVGSVNFTNPAWAGSLKNFNEIYNIESALLYSEKVTSKKYLLSNQLDVKGLKFLICSDEETWLERFQVPDIRFKMDWQSGILSWEASVNFPCVLFLTATLSFPINDIGSIKIRECENSDLLIESLSRHPLMNVEETVKEEVRTHIYYLQQDNFEFRPLQVRISATEIIEAWQLLGSEDELNEWLIGRIESYLDVIQDESGKIINEKFKGKSLLNEMARHFYGLAHLEKSLFNIRKHEIGNVQLKLDHFNNLKYYLSHDNVDTLISYVKDLEKMHNEGNLLTAYYWLILTIVQKNIYMNSNLNILLEAVNPDTPDKKLFKSSIRTQIECLEIERERALKLMDIETDKIDWVIEKLEEEI